MPKMSTADVKLAEHLTRQLRKFCRAKGWKPADLARAIGIPLDADFKSRAAKVYKWLNKENPPLFQSATLAQLSKTDVSLDWLFGRDVPMLVTEREPVGELAAALAEHVVAECLKQRNDTSWRLSVAEAVGVEWQQVRDADGGRRNQLIVTNARPFVDGIIDDVARKAQGLTDQRDGPLSLHLIVTAFEELRKEKPGAETPGLYPEGRKSVEEAMERGLAGVAAFMKPRAPKTVDPSLYRWKTNQGKK